MNSHVSPSSSAPSEWTARSAVLWAWAAIAGGTLAAVLAGPVVMDGLTRV